MPGIVHPFAYYVLDNITFFSLVLLGVCNPIYVNVILFEYYQNLWSEKLAAEIHFYFHFGNLGFIFKTQVSYLLLFF